MFVFVGFTVLVMGWSDSVKLHQEWFAAMMDHSDYLGSRHTLFSLSSLYLGLTLPTHHAFYLFPLVSLALAYYCYRIANRPAAAREGAPAANTTSLMLLFFLLMALIPSFFVTDTEHFLFALPLIVICCFQRDVASRWWVVMLVVVLVLYGGNSSDLLGKGLSVSVNRWGILGISNLLLIGMSLFWFSGREKRAAANPDL